MVTGVEIELTYLKQSVLAEWMLEEKHLYISLKQRQPSSNGYTQVEMARLASVVPYCFVKPWSLTRTFQKRVGLLGLMVGSHELKAVMTLFLVSLLVRQTVSIPISLTALERTL